MKKINVINSNIKNNIKHFYNSGRKISCYVITILAIIYDFLFAFFSASLENTAVGVLVVAEILLIPLFWLAICLIPFQKENVENYLSSWRKDCKKNNEYYSKRVTHRILMKARICILLGIIVLLCIIPVFVMKKSIKNQHLFFFLAHALFVFGTFLIKFGCFAKGALKDYICKKCGCCFCFEETDSKTASEIYTQEAKWDSEEVVVGQINVGKSTTTLKSQHYFITEPASEWTSYTTDWVDVCYNCHHTEKRKKTSQVKNKDL